MNFSSLLGEAEKLARPCDGVADGELSTDEDGWVGDVDEAEGAEAVQGIHRLKTVVGVGAAPTDANIPGRAVARDGQSRWRARQAEEFQRVGVADQVRLARGDDNENNQRGRI